MSVCEGGDAAVCDFVLTTDIWTSLRFAVFCHGARVAFEGACCALLVYTYRNRYLLGDPTSSCGYVHAAAVVVEQMIDKYMFLLMTNDRT
jgi:hypothetical protein